MDPKDPKPKDRKDPESPVTESARERVRSLTAKEPESKESAPGKESAKGAEGRPALTERQRIEARRARQAKRNRRPAGNREPVEGNPLSKGMRATGLEIRRTAAFIGKGIIAGLASLGPVFSKAGMGLVWLIDRSGKGLAALWRLITRLAALLGRVVLVLDRVFTPQRASILVAAVAAVLLGVAQHKGLGLIEIGQSGYRGIEDLARAPAIDRTTPAGVHTGIFIPIAAIAFAAVATIALGSIGAFAKRLARFRRLAAMTLVTIGLLTLVVTLLVDLPEATDTTEAALAYTGAKARLLTGFWLELTAGAALAVTGLALLFEPSPGRAASRQRDRDRRERSRSTRSHPGKPEVTA